jgi:small GTP-binding protein
LKNAVYHRDSNVTQAKITEFFSVWEQAHDIRALISAELKDANLAQVIQRFSDLPSLQTFSIALLGDKGVGKSCLVKRLIWDRFEPDLRVTLGVLVDNLLMKLPSRMQDTPSTVKEVKLIIYDFAGQETFRAMYSNLLADKDAILFVFSLNDPNSLLGLVKWIELVQKNATSKKELFLIATKKDLDNQGIHPDLLWDLRKKYRLDFYYETSALTGFNVQRVFEELAEHLIMQQVNE